MAAAVQGGQGREGPGEEVGGGSRGAGVQALHPLQGPPLVQLEGLELSPGEEEGGEAGVKTWGAEGGLDPQRGGRVAPVASGQAAGHQGVRGLAVGGEAGHEGRHVASNHVLSLSL